MSSLNTIYNGILAIDVVDFCLIFDKEAISYHRATPVGNSSTNILSNCPYSSLLPLVVLVERRLVVAEGSPAVVGLVGNSPVVVGLVGNSLVAEGGLVDSNLVAGS